MLTAPAAASRPCARPIPGSITIELDAAALLTSPEGAELHLVTTTGERLRLLLACVAVREMAALMACSGGVATTAQAT